MLTLRGLPGLVLLLIAILVGAGPSPFAALARAAAPESPIQKEYRSLCESRHLTCALAYGGGKEAPEPEAKRDRPAFGGGGDPVFGGPVAIFAVFAGLAIIAVLGLRFGAGGVLLSTSPVDDTRKSERPQHWQAAELVSGESGGFNLDQLALMKNRREAVIRLLHQCLLHAADKSGTRLMRSDTERTVFARLPADLPNRQALEHLLGEAELVHYGGHDVDDDQFARLMATGRALILGEGGARG